MFSVRQNASRCVQRHAVHRTIRKASTEHGKKDSHGHHEGPKTEPLGTQFYVVVAAIPLCYGTYVLSQPSKDGSAPALTKLIERYSDFKDSWSTRNSLHVEMLDQVAHDRHLFYGSKASGHVDLRFPEMFNTGSPYNVPAGQGGANLDKLVAHYQNLNADELERKARALDAKENSKK